MHDSSKNMTRVDMSIWLLLCVLPKNLVMSMYYGGFDSVLVNCKTFDERIWDICTETYV